MDEDEITVLKRALQNQLLIMRKLSNELEEEREASASGADEALTMILRLQKEKAEEKMEACQYKQMAEAKILHTEQSLAMLEHVIHQKDVEIASLKHQVHVYKQILLRDSVHSADIIKVDDLWFSNSTSMDRTSSCIQFRRQNSLPSIRFRRLCSEIALTEGDGPLDPTLQSVWREISDSQSQLMEHRRHRVSECPVIEELNFEENQVEEVCASVVSLETQSGEQKAITRTISESQINMTVGPQGFEFESTSCSRQSSEYCDVPVSSCLEAEIGTKINYVSSQQKCSECLPPRPTKKVLQSPHLEAKQMSGLPESRPEGSMQYFLGDNDFSKAPKLPTLRKVSSLKSRPNFLEPTVQPYSVQTEVEQLKHQIQLLADDVRILKQEDLKNGDEQLKLLKKIHEQLKPVQSHIRHSKSRTPSPYDEALFDFLTEVCLTILVTCGILLCWL